MLDGWSSAIGTVIQTYTAQSRNEDVVWVVYQHGYPPPSPGHDVLHPVHRCSYHQPRSIHPFQPMHRQPLTTSNSIPHDTSTPF